jgi:site-specific DNA-methyltransferase (adenine-specific)
MSAILWCGDSLQRLTEIPDCSIDAVVTDPPYGIGIMGELWDTMASVHEYQAFSLTWGREALRVLKPGGHLLAFSASRMAHRQTAGLEDAGFEIRDLLYWAYATGMAKSKNLAGDWTGWGTQLSPAVEPIVLARKPLSEATVEANVARWGTGALHIDACRTPYEAGGTAASNPLLRPTIRGGAGGRTLFHEETVRYSTPHTGGRWPATLITEPGCDAITPILPIEAPERYFPQAEWSDLDALPRVAYCPKPTTDEREAGLDGFPLCEHHRYGSIRTNRGAGYAEASAYRNPTKCLKPIALLRWLMRLVTVPGGLVLDPFMGSGSGGCAAALEGFDYHGIEIDPAHVAIAEARVLHWSAGSTIIAADVTDHPVAAPQQLSLFS